MLQQALSDELVLAKYGKGVALVTPDSLEGQRQNAICYLNNLLMAPYSVYLLSKYESRLLLVNDVNASLFEATSPHDLYGRTVADFVSDTREVKAVLDNDMQVLKTEDILITEEIADIELTQVHVLTIKVPCYQNDTLLGILGMSIPVQKSLLGQGLNEIARLGLLPSPINDPIFPKPDTISKRWRLSKREQEVLEQVVKGFSAKRIAEKMFLSVRTIEHHIDNIKHKLNAKSKFELIDIYNS